MKRKTVLSLVHTESTQIGPQSAPKQSNGLTQTPPNSKQPAPRPRAIAEILEEMAASWYNEDDIEDLKIYLDFLEERVYNNE